jgi:hypothetical protein
MSPGCASVRGRPAPLRRPPHCGNGSGNCRGFTIPFFYTMSLNLKSRYHLENGRHRRRGMLRRAGRSSLAPPRPPAARSIAAAPRAGGHGPRPSPAVSGSSASGFAAAAACASSRMPCSNLEHRNRALHRIDAAWPSGKHVPSLTMRSKRSGQRWSRRGVRGVAIPHHRPQRAMEVFRQNRNQST